MSPWCPPISCMVNNAVSRWKLLFSASVRGALSGGRYRVSQTVLRRDSLSDFIDGCEDFAKLRTLILQARAAAMNDADAEPVPGRGFDIELDELVMA